MQGIPDPLIYKSDMLSFQDIKYISALVSELLSNNDTKKAFELAASKSEVNGWDLEQPCAYCNFQGCKFRY